MLILLRVLGGLFGVVGLAGLAAVIVPGDQTRDLPVGLAIFAMGVCLLIASLLMAAALSALRGEQRR